MEILIKIVFFGLLFIIATDIILYLILKLKTRNIVHGTIERCDVGAKAEESTRERQPLEISDSVVITENDQPRVGVVQTKKNIRAYKGE